MSQIPSQILIKIIYFYDIAINHIPSTPFIANGTAVVAAIAAPIVPITISNSIDANGHSAATPPVSRFIVVDLDLVQPTKKKLPRARTFCNINI